MPIYNFICKKCGKTMDILVGINQEKNEMQCQCGSKDLEKQFSCFGVGKGHSHMKDLPSPCATNQCHSGGGCAGMGHCPMM